MENQRPNIFEYSDFREFLKDYYSHQKTDNDNFSYRYFSQKAGFTAPNIFHLVMLGKRNLTKDSTVKFAQAIGFGKKEQQYFEALVSFNQAKTPETKRYYLELLHNIKERRHGAQLKKEQFEYASNWYYVAIRELVALPSFEESPEWIKKQLKEKITLRQAKDAIDRLLQLGLLARNAEGKLVQTDALVVTDDEVAKTAVYSFHQQMLTLAKEILAEATTNHHEISGTTVAVSEKQFREIKKMIHDFHGQIERYIVNNPDVPQSVFQLNVQLFSLTNGMGGSKR